MTVRGEFDGSGGRVLAALTAGERLRQQYREHNLIGTFVMELPTPRAVRVLALAGFDFVVLDMEHSSCGIETIAALITEAQLAGLPAIVRTWSPDAGLIGRVLDAGANGIMVGHVGSPEEAVRAVEAARYGPLGHRGLAPLTAFGAGGADPIALGSSVLVIAQIEGVAAVEACGEIAAVPGIDAVFVGPYDLSQALGQPGVVDSPAVMRAAARVAEDCREAAMLGIYVDDPSASAAWAERGFGLQCVGFDGRMLLAGAQAVVRAARPG